MHKKMTISLDEDIYDGLYKTIGKRKMSQFIEDLVRPHVLGAALEAEYKTMAADSEREKEASDWCTGLTKDFSKSDNDETW